MLIEEIDSDKRRPGLAVSRVTAQKTESRLRKKDDLMVLKLPAVSIRCWPSETVRAGL